MNKLVGSVRTNFNERGDEIKRHWGGGSLGGKSAAKVLRSRRPRPRRWP